MDYQQCDLIQGECEHSRWSTILTVFLGEIVLNPKAIPSDGKEKKNAETSQNRFADSRGKRDEIEKQKKKREVENDGLRH